MELPDLFLLEVFSLVNTEEGFRTLRLVCKRWKQLAEYQFKTVKSLIVYHENHPFHRRWPSDDRELSCLEMMKQPFFHFYLASDHYKSLKKLYLYQVTWARFEKAQLMTRLEECMTQLEELSIDRSSLSPYNYDIKKHRNIDIHGLTFPNLRVLSAKQKLAEKISITAPNLEKLTVWDLYLSYSSQSLKIDVSHPEKLKYLEVDTIGPETKVFANVEHLVARRVNLDFHLSHYSKLRRLDLCINRDRWSPQPVYLSIENLLQQKEQLKLEHIQITNFGVKNLIPEHDIEGELVTLKDRFLFYEFDMPQFLSNYSNFAVDRLPWIGWVRYSASLQDHQHLASCCSKLNIQVLRVYSTGFPTDPALLIKFLIDIGGINCLVIGYSFGQEFYDQLSSVPFIGVLTIVKKARLPINFDFICEIPLLYVIHLEHYRVPIYSLQKNLKKAKITEFSIGNRIFEFFPEGSGYTIFFSFRKVHFEDFKVLDVSHEINIDTLDEGFAYLNEMEMCRQTFV